MYCIRHQKKDHYLFCGNELKVNDNRKIGDLNCNEINITIVPSEEIKANNLFIGKIIKVTMFHKKKNIFKNYSIPENSPISWLFNLDDDLKNKKILYNGKELNKNDKLYI